MIATWYRKSASFLPSDLANLAAWFRLGVGITTATGVSQWDDQSGNGRHLKQGTGANQPALQGDNTILFDGSAHYLKCDAFTLNQPTTIYILFKQVSWTANDVVYDGNTVNVQLLWQRTASPGMMIYAGTNSSVNNNLAVGTYGSVAAVYNGANGVFQINNTTPLTGNYGAVNAAGFTLGATGTPVASFGNIQVKEVIIYAAAHDQTTRDQVIAYLGTL